MENDTEVSNVLFMNLERIIQLLLEGSVTYEYKDQLKSYVELVEDTIGMLEALLGFRKWQWYNCSGKFSSFSSI